MDKNSLSILSKTAIFAVTYGILIDEKSSTFGRIEFFFVRFTSRIFFLISVEYFGKNGNCVLYHIRYTAVTPFNLANRF